MCDMKDLEWDDCIQPDDTEYKVSHLPVAYELEVHRIIQCEAFLIAEKDLGIKPLFV